MHSRIKNISVISAHACAHAETVGWAWVFKLSGTFECFVKSDELTGIKDEDIYVVIDES